MQSAITIFKYRLNTLLYTVKFLTISFLIIPTIPSRLLTDASASVA